MAVPVIVATLETDNFSDVDQFDRAIGQFGAGELGQIDIPLDPNIAVDEYANLIQQSVNDLDQAMFDEGLLPWPEFSNIAYLEWEDRTVRLLFRIPGGPSPAPPPDNDIDPEIYGERIAYVPARYGSGVRDVLETKFSVANTDYIAMPQIPTPSIWAFALFRGLLGRSGGLLKRDASMRQFAARGGRPLVVTAADAAALRTARLVVRESVRAQRGVGRLPSLSFLVGAGKAGALLFLLMVPGALIAVIKWTADQAWNNVIKPTLEGAGDAAQKALEQAAENLKEVFGGYGIYIIGGGAVLVGLWLATR